MTPTERKLLLAKFNAGPPARASAISELESKTGALLPKGYAQFLREMDGGEGFIGGSAYVILWPASEVVDMNNGYHVSEFAPGLLLIGTDGGGEGYAFDTRSGTLNIVAIPLVGMDLNEVRILATDFDGFLRALSSPEVGT